MPRLSRFDHRQHYMALRVEWLRGGLAFSILTPTEQIAIHNFYEPSLDLSPRELVELRRRVTTADPLLPQRAGKAFARIAPFLDGPLPKYAGTVTVQPGRRKGTAKVVSVTSLVHPHVDPAKIAQILVWAAMDEAKRQRLRDFPLPEARQDDDEFEDAA